MVVSDDAPDGAAIRADQTVMDAHWAYELSIKHKILCAGSLRSDDGVTPIGSLLVLDVATREEAPTRRPRPDCAARSRSSAGTRRSSAAWSRTRRLYFPPASAIIPAIAS
jgi:hypothetical protein